MLNGAAGVGKTAAIRNLCASLPEPDFRVVYLCDTAVTACDLYRTLALELGLKPAHRRAQLWWELKRTIAHLVEQQHTLPVLVIDEAQQLSDEFLGDLGGFLNFAFDRKTLLTLWLVGLPQLTVRLRMRHHAPLATRIVAHVQLEPLAREDFAALIAHGAKAAGARGCRRAPRAALPACPPLAPAARRTRPGPRPTRTCRRAGDGRSHR